MRRYIFLPIILILAFALGCSSGGDTPLIPSDNQARDSATASSHQLWGMWQFIADPDAGTLDFVPLRQTDMHLNAIVFLEPPPLVNLTLESLQFNGDIIEADIGLRHPFLGLTEFTGFDVCGILISRGSVGGFSDPDLLMPGENDLHLLNPDALTRWWNPAEFPVNTKTMFGYNDGLLGTPEAVGQYDATLNGYKYFCVDFNGPNDPMSMIDPEGRGVFMAGSKIVRHYSIQMGDAGLIFNYAIDANWQFPNGQKPWSAPDDFAPEANRPEAWNITYTTIENTLWNDGVDNGGNLSLAFDVYDWFNADMNTVRLDSPGNFPMTESATATGGGTGYSTYQIDILDATPGETTIDILVTAECEATGYGDLLPGKTQALYTMISVPVDNEAPPVETDPEEWACFQYNAANIGRNPNTQGFDPDNYMQKWYQDDTGRKYTGLAVTDDLVFCVANPWSVYTNTTYHITCFSMVDGAIVWQKYLNPQNEYQRGFTSPAYFEIDGNRRVVVGGDRLYCLEAESGNEVWTYRDDLQFIRCSPKVVDGKVYIAAATTIHCVDASDGSAVWVSDPGVAGGECVPAVVDGRVYSGYGTTWTCLDADDGSQIWHVDTGSSPTHWAAPLVLDGRLYYCSYSQHFVCLDIEDGTKIWEYNESGSDYDNVWNTALTYWDDPSDSKHVLYFGGAYGAGIHAVKDNGTSASLVWRDPGIYADASPIYCEGVVYIGDRNSNTLFGYDPATGAKVFTQPVNGGVAGAAAFAFGRLVFGTDNGVYAFE